MERLADLGSAIARLRNLHGLSIEACAARIGTTVERLLATERGEVDPADLEGIARLYAIDEDGLREGMVRPLEGLGGATIFLLHGAYQDFDARDLGVLERAMRAARGMTALTSSSAEGRDRLRRRIRFVPAAPAGPRPADAARQGYRLARHVRAEMRLGGDPIGDIRVFVEEQLGIAVMVDELVSHGLRAAAILDLHRAAATAVLAAGDPEREKNPMLARVYLAHELCHLLFDPGSPGSVRLVLEDRLDERASGGAGLSQLALLESRAKGFAAELLIPLEGLNGLLGAPAAPEASLGSARTMVARVRDHFGTPWEIATRHLGNLGFVRKELTLDLLDERPLPPAARHPTSLPARAAQPLLLERSLEGRAGPDVSTAGVAGPAADITRDAPPYFGEVQRAASMAIDDLGTAALVAASQAVERGRETEAVDLLVEHLDNLFQAGEFEAARRVLAKLDPHGLPPKVLTGVLMVSAHAREQLGAARDDLVARVQTALAQTWGLRPEMS